MTYLLLLSLLTDGIIGLNLRLRLQFYGLDPGRQQSGLGRALADPDSPTGANLPSFPLPSSFLPLPPLRSIGPSNTARGSGGAQ